MQIVELVLLLSVISVLWLLWRGPTPWDRLLAYNSASNRVVVTVCLIAISSREVLLFDVAIGYAAWSFLGVVIVSRFLERGGGHR